MPSPLLWVLQRTLTLAPTQVSSSRRGFRVCEPSVRERLEGIGCSVLVGHHAALAARDTPELIARLERVANEQRGFAYEGAALGLALLDTLTFGDLRRWRALLGNGAEHHIYMHHVGLGLAWARLRRSLALPIAGVDPLLGALVADGYGFHDGYFRTQRALRAEPVPSRIRGYAARAYDQGLGRSLWFVHSTDPDAIAASIARFAPERHGHLWSGVGLACTYAGGQSGAGIVRLLALSGPNAVDLAQGAAFAAEARDHARNSAPHVQLACEILCRCNAIEAARLARATRVDLPASPDGSSYEEWRHRLRSAFATEALAG